MRAFKRNGKEGFTLVELMIVVAIIGVLAALAIFGVNRYLGASKSAEAKQTVGAITRAAVAAYDRDVITAEVLTAGTASAVNARVLCLTATTTPDAVPAGRKSLPDFNTGGQTDGWKCLKFSLDQPVMYQYGYGKDARPAMTQGTVPTSGTNSVPLNNPGFHVVAEGDVDNNAEYSWFHRTATIIGTTKELNVSTQVGIVNEYE